MGDNVDTADEGAATRGQDAGGEHAGSGALAGPIGTEQAEDLSSAHGEVEAVDREDVARIDLRETFGADHLVVDEGCCAHGFSNPSDSFSPPRALPPRNT
jgi:hypothetical protein